MFNCVLICAINQMAVEAGEELLTSVSEFEHPHCLVQDLTISKWGSFYWDWIIYYKNLLMAKWRKYHEKIRRVKVWIFLWLHWLIILNLGAVFSVLHNCDIIYQPHLCKNDQTPLLSASDDRIVVKFNIVIWGPYNEMQWL